MAKKEETIAVCRRHWTAYIKQGIVALLFTFLGFVSLSFEKTSTVFTVILFAVALLAVSYIWADYGITYIVLKKTSLELRINGNHKIMPLSKVQGIDLDVNNTGVLSIIFGCYTITLSNAGKEYICERMAKADRFVDLVSSQIAKMY